MTGRTVWLVCLGSIGFWAALGGCQSHPEVRFDEARRHYNTVATEIEYPDVAVPGEGRLAEAPPPHTVRRDAPGETWPLTLEEAIRITLANSEIIRGLGGQMVTLPAAAPSAYDPAVSETDPRLGPEAALSAFDAQFSTSIFWEDNDRAVNNILLGNQNLVFLQDLTPFRAEISKQSATGTEFALRELTTYDKNNRFGNVSGATYDTMVEAEVRHPLWQGAGMEFNRIAGPRALPGAYNGLLLARINTDISLADFEAGVLDLLFQVEQAYWDLYFAYRDLDAKTAGRDHALQTWRLVQRKYEAGTADDQQEALAREQYFLFDTQVINALGGAASGGGALAAAAGVYASERRLRWLLGLPANDGRIIRPADEPSSVEVCFDWHGSLQDALCRRVELRKQQWVIKRRELELIAARNFLKMRLDLAGRYRWRGLGDDLLGSDQSAFAQMFDGNHQEWQLGVQLSTPVGNRIGHTAVRHAELQLARERARYRQQELQILDDASRAFGEMDRSYAVSRSSFNRREAAHRQLEEVQKKCQAGLVPLEFLLDAQRRSVEADAAFYRALVDYNLAVTRVFLASGTLLDRDEVYLAEGPWSPAAHRSAAKESRRFVPRLLDYGFSTPPAVSLGVYRQQQLPRGGKAAGESQREDSIRGERESEPGGGSYERIPSPPGEALPPVADPAE